MRLAWVDTALSLRRHRQQLLLSVELRAAAAPQPSTLTLVGTDRDMHLALVAAQPLAPHNDPGPTTDIDSAILDALDHADIHGLTRGSLRAALRVRNLRLGEALARLADSGLIIRNGDSWSRLAVPVPAHIDTLRNRNGND